MPIELLKSNLNRFKTRKFVIHSDLTILGRDINHLKGNAVATFRRELETESLAIPTFNLNTNSSNVVDFSSLDLSMGALPNEAMRALEIKNFGFRLPNPIHSYALFPFEAKFRKIDCKKSFGKGSIFDYFFEENYCWVSFGADVGTGFTMFHHLEYLAKVPYRKEVFFDRKILHDKKETTVRFKYYSRVNGNFQQNFEKAVQVLIQKKALTINKVGLKCIYTGLVQDIADVVLNKLRDDPFFLVDKNDW